MKRRTTGLYLLAFGLLTLTSMVLTNVPDIGESNVDAESFYAVGSNRIQAVVAFYVLVGALACLGALLATVLPAVDRPGIAGAAWLAGSVYIGLQLIGGAAFLIPTATVALGFTEADAVDPVFARTMSMWGDAMLLLAGPVALGALVFLLGRALRSIGALGRWVTGSGAVVAVLLVLGGWTWFPLPLAVLWALVAAVRLLVARPAPAPQDRRDHDVAVAKSA